MWWKMINSRWRLILIATAADGDCDKDHVPTTAPDNCWFWHDAWAGVGSGSSTLVFGWCCWRTPQFNIILRWCWGCCFAALLMSNPPLFLLYSATVVQSQRLILGCWCWWWLLWWWQFNVVRWVEYSSLCRRRRNRRQSFRLLVDGGGGGISQGCLQGRD